jgi:hypothetical protein
MTSLGRQLMGQHPTRQSPQVKHGDEQRTLFAEVAP